MIRIIASVLLVLAVSAPASAASDAFLKFDGVKGETKKGQANTSVPAVQKAPEAAKGKKKGNVEYEWKVEAGEK